MAHMKPSGKIHADGVHFYEELDDRVVRLVAALNSLPCVSTISSCGGHRKPDKVQVGAGEFRVRFNSTAPADCQSLRLINRAISQVDWDRCSGCRACMRVCQFGAIGYSAAQKKAFVDARQCYGCGVYRAVCPKDAIELEERTAVAEAARLW